MKKNKIKEVLSRSKISAKWNNMGTWTKEECENIYEFVKKNNIKIRRQKDGSYKITSGCGRMKIIKLSSFAELERDLCKIFVLNCLYLGDRYKIKTRLIIPIKDLK